MSDVVLYIAASVDSYIAREDGSIDWLEPYEGGDYGYEAFYAGVDTLLVGGNTYRQALGFGEWPYPGKRVIVFTRHEPADGDERVEFVTHDVAGFVSRLKEQPGGVIWLVGGARIVATLIDAHLVDELIVSVVPVLLRSGIPLAWPGDGQVGLDLVRSAELEGGIVQLTYRVHG
jgi:dihydrofolate reductase